MIRLITGEADVAAPSPVATANRSEPTPNPVPIAKGIARQNPRCMPCARLIMLFGPGVAVAIRQNNMKGAREISAISARPSVCYISDCITCRKRPVLNQSDMMTVLGDPANRDRGRFRVLPGFGGTALFDADFSNFVFAPHFHDTLMLGLIFEGQKRFVRGRTTYEVGAGGLSIVNPGDTHTGGVVGINRRLRYTAVYPSAALLHEAGFPDG